MTEPSEPLLCLRPGAHLYPLSPDELQVSFPNYTATFVSPPVVRGVTELLAQFAVPAARTTAVAAAAARCGLEPAFVDYLVSMMTNSQCLYESSSRPAADELSAFYAFLGRDPAATRAALAAGEVVVVEGDGADDAGEGATSVLEQAGVRVQALQVKPGTAVVDVLSAVRERLSGRPRLLACWGVPYRLPMARAINDLAITEDVPVLFGCTEGVVGRVGPLVVPRTTSCLECLNRRLLTHAGNYENVAFAQYRTRFADTVPEPWPTHPTWRGAVLRLYALEVVTVLLDQPPQTIGGFVEHSYPGGSARRHPVYRVPRCPSCHVPRPRSWAWDARSLSAAEATAAE